MSEIGDKLNGTAWHEAAHVVVLHHYNCDVDSVEVTDQDSGETIPNQEHFQAMNDEEVAIVALAGVQGEIMVRKEYTIEEFFDIMAGAKGDRSLYSRRAKHYWSVNALFNLQIKENTARNLVEDNRVVVERVASALLAKPGFPKILDRNEIAQLLH